MEFAEFPESAVVWLTYSLRAMALAVATKVKVFLGTIHSAGQMSAWILGPLLDLLFTSAMATNIVVPELESKILKGAFN